MINPVALNISPVLNVGINVSFHFLEFNNSVTNLNSGRCIFHRLMHYIFPDDSNRVRIHKSGRVAPGLTDLKELKV